MPRHSHRRGMISTVTPSLVFKRILDDDSFVDFCNYSSQRGWAKRSAKHRTDALRREDPLELPDFAVPYSLDKKRRWELPEIIEEKIGELQDPDLNLRVSATHHTCSSSITSRITWPWGKERPRLSAVYHNVTREGYKQRRGSRRADINTFECESQEADNRLHVDFSRPEKCSQKEEDKLFQKVHVRYSMFTVTGWPGRYSKSSLNASSYQPRGGAGLEDYDELHFCSCESHIGFEYSDSEEDDENLETPSMRILADFIGTKRERKRTKTRKLKKRSRFCDEEMEETLFFDDFEIVSEVSSESSFDLVEASTSASDDSSRSCPHCRRVVEFSGNRLDSCSCGAVLCGSCPSLLHSPISCDEALLYQQYLTKSGIEPFFEITPSITRITDLVRCPGCGQPMQRERDALT